ncbi:MAG TPA: hypothetical protein VHR66_28070 [Gemmataceae bacterium]|nr:hypothetical protein [Gemmataceae bacterium]
MTTMLDKGGQTDGRVNYPKLGVLTWVVSPLVVLAALCVWWRHNKVVAKVGLVALAAAVGMIVGGSLIDHLSWRDKPYPQNQITYLGTFFGFLGALGICLAFGLLGAGAWVVRRRQAVRCTS